MSVVAVGPIPELATIVANDAENLSASHCKKSIRALIRFDWRYDLTKKVGSLEFIWREVILMWNAQGA